MNSATVVTTYKNEAGTITVKSDTVEGDLTLNIERSAIPVGTTDAEFVVSFTVATIKAFGMGCVKSKTTPAQSPDKVAKLTVKTNSSGSPDDTFALTPANGLGWSAGDPAANPFTADVTKLFVTVDADAITDFTLRMLIDSTPVLPG